MNFHANLYRRGVLQLAGPDSRQFLQGQTTCDVNQLVERDALPGAYCTPQGRMVCDFRLIALNDTDCLLSMHRDICDNSAAVFGKYIVFSKARVCNASEDWEVFAAWGDSIAAALEDEFDEAGPMWTQVDEAGHRFECHCPAQQAGALWQRLRQCTEEAGEAAWQLEEILAGLGHVEAETAGMFIPQMLNYQATGQISFSKGCYTGQEVVARLHYRGKVKRPMYLASAEAPAPAAATALFKPDNEQSVGNVVNAVTVEDGCRLLVVCASAAAAGQVHLGAPGGAVLNFLPLPYALPE